MQPFSLRLSAHMYEVQADGRLCTKMIATHTTTVPELDSFAAAKLAVQTFGVLHAPCSVWVVCPSPRKPRGFADHFPARPDAHLFPVAAGVAREAVAVSAD